MNLRTFYIPLVLLLVLAQRSNLWAQEKLIGDTTILSKGLLPGVPRLLGLNPRLVTINDSLWVISGICKVLRREKYTEAKAVISSTKPTEKKRQSLLQVHGNVQYDFLHRSYVDTPFAQRDFNQHTVQASLRVTVKDKYPLKMNIATRASNSPYFRNFLDLGLQLDQYNYVKNYRQQLLDKAKQSLYQSPELKSMEAALKEKIERLQALKARLAEPDIFQRIVEEREKRYLEKYKREVELIRDSSTENINLQQLNGFLTRKKIIPSLPNKDSLLKDKSYADFIDSKKKELDSLQQDLTRFQRKTDSVRRNVEKSIATLRQKISQARNKNELKRLARENEWIEEKEKGFDHFLSNVRSVGIGRSMVSYSELTAWNISLTGFNLEYNDSKVYGAIAAGRMDYGFRDFFGSNSRARQQSLFMARAGIGDKENKALILSAFTGRKYNYGIVQADSVSSYVNLTGYSIEAIWKKDAYTSFSAELAKTTRPVTGRPGENNSLQDLFDLGDKRNLGISVKGQTRLEKTDTKVEGFLRKTGEHFQSFSLFTYNTDQTAWQLKVDQPLLKNRIGLIGMLRRNDFTHPFADKTFKTSTVFTSIQATARFARWPVFSVGYFPGTQLYIEDKKRVLENVYYMLNASVIYQYNLGIGRMISSAIYNRYSGKGTDSGFIAYSGANYMLSQSLLLRKVQFQGMYSFTDQERMRYNTLELGADYTITKSIRIGGSGKYNSIMGGDHYWGSRVYANIEFRQLGGLQLQYDKSYLPTVYGDLFPVESGRITWFKFF